ncbi:BlaI/MecI/CopY family transcriptional regulator [Terrabacter terrigena]|uniref:BlaI/MecI/CopY family transcriptional regulator n=1 Tax=Terrabacter terrigena TaxID=574718 RepID=A0ABW3MZR1_9MICO
MTSGERGARARGGLEREVLATVAAATAPMSTAQVHAQLGPQLAYTTVMTTLARLHEKGVLRREKRGRAFAYELATRVEDVDASMTAHRMHRLLEAEADRAGVLARFVADLSSEDEALLTGLLSGSPDDPGTQPGAPRPAAGD